MFWLVVFARQATLMAVSVLLGKQVLGEGDGPEYAQVGVTILVLALALVAHLRVCPFEEEALPGVSQNKLETTLLCLNIFSMSTAMLHNGLKSSVGGAADVIDGLLSAMLIFQLSAPVICISYTLFRSEEIRHDFSSESMRNLFRAVTGLRGPKAKGPSQTTSADSVSV